jgi:murein DD-endopeptidase MepM/ murein hydrolase activator NlpD
VLLLLSIPFPVAQASTTGTRRHPVLRLEPGTVKPGDAILITVAGARPPLAASIGDRPLTFFRAPGGFQAVAAIRLEQPPGELPIVVRLSENSAEELQGQLEVIAAGFPSRELEVANRYVHPSEKAKRWMAEDHQAFKRAYAQPWIPPFFHRAFIWPRTAEVTAHFGDLRMFNGQKQSQHYGTDLNGQVGDPVSAANDGTVVLARSCYASGNTILIQHGAGLFTGYFHLSKMQVKPGTKVKRGERIGLVGKSGRVTGPHLHWAVKVEDAYVNPESLLALHFE